MAGLLSCGGFRRSGGAVGEVRRRVRNGGRPPSAPARSGRWRRRRAGPARRGVRRASSTRAVIMSSMRSGAFRRRITSRTASQAVLVQVAVRPEQGAQPFPVLVTGQPPGLRQQGGGPVAAYVVGVGLAGVLGVPEQAQQVVPQLERLAQRQPVRGVALAQPLTGPGQQRRRSAGAARRCTWRSCSGSPSASRRVGAAAPVRRISRHSPAISSRASAAHSGRARPR